MRERCRQDLLAFRPMPTTAAEAGSARDGPQSPPAPPERAQPIKAAVAAWISVEGSGIDRTVIEPFEIVTGMTVPSSSVSETAGNAIASIPPDVVALTEYDTWARPKTSPGLTVRNPGEANSESEAVNAGVGKLSEESGPPPGTVVPEEGPSGSSF